MPAKKSATRKVWVDPDDAPELTEGFFKQATLMVGDRVVERAEYKAAHAKARGRPKAAVTKERITIRLSPDVLNSFRATGSGWQTRVDAALRDWIKRQARSAGRTSR